MYQNADKFQQFDDILQKIDFSSGRRINAWRIFLTPEVDIRFFFNNKKTAALHSQILQQSVHLQMIFLDETRLFVYHLQPDNGIEIDETPLDLMKFAGGNEKLVNGYKKSKNLLFYAQSKDIEGLFEVRSILHELTDPDRKSDYDTFVPEAPVMRTLINHLSVKNIGSAYKSEGLYAGQISPGSKELQDNRIKYIEIRAELENPDCVVKIFLYSSEEEVRLLNLVYSNAPADKKSDIQRYSAEHGVQFQTLPKRIIVARPGNKRPDKTSDPQSIKKILDYTIELINLIDPNLSMMVPWSSMSSSDPFYYWEDILDYSRIY